MAQEEYERRLLEQRRRDLRDGLMSVVDAVLDLDRWLVFVDWPDARSLEEAAGVLTRAIGEFVKARAGLLLDRDAEPIVRETSTLSLDADRYRGLLIERREFVAAGQAGGDPQLVADLSVGIRDLKQ